ncbi:MAG TPA: hypothetical protein VEJ86_13010, partial [Candidatus Binataceae bacterium]|nr:hypothetical protein [Candidatus Binataceae bacterium]
LFGNVLYIPAKLVYALLGGMVGGGAWLVTAGNTQTADTIWRSCFGGDYVLTPQMVSGDQPINFSGPTETAPPPAAGVAPVNSPAGAGAAQSMPAGNGSRPMDSGSGPVGGSAPALPNTSVE